MSLGASAEGFDPFGGLGRAGAFRLLGRAAGRLRAGLRCASDRNPRRVAVGAAYSDFTWEVLPVAGRS